MEQNIFDYLVEGLDFNAFYSFIDSKTDDFRHRNAIFMTSFSENENSLPMWNMYGKNGNGVIIGFDLELLKSCSEGTIEKYKATGGWKDFKNIVEGTPTGITSVTSDKETTNAPIYDLNGRRLTEPQKGINIIGGKKVLNH